MRLAIEKRFWSRVVIGESDECWLYRGGLGDGYGHFWVFPGELDGVEVRRNVGAHRVAFRLTHGRWPQPLALHGCDRPACCNAVNPSHIHEGTQGMNIQESIARGRYHRPGGPSGGELHPMARLTDVQAVEIRRLRSQGALIRQLAARFGVSESTISNVALGRCYK